MVQLNCSFEGFSRTDQVLEKVVSDPHRQSEIFFPFTSDRFEVLRAKERIASARKDFWRF
jgi:hypothetical protein